MTTNYNSSPPGAFMMVSAQIYFNLLLYKTPPLTLIRGHAMAQAVSYRLLTSEAEFQVSL